MKRSKNKIIVGLALIFVLIIMILISSLRKKPQEGGDYRIGILADDGVSMVTISPERQMINFLSLNPDSQLWIPEGMGWYRNEVIKKILVQEKRVDLINNILFYNFGFVADKIIILNQTDDWQSKLWLLLLRNNDLIKKTEVMAGDVDKNEAFLDKIMVRDFSETKVINDDLKLSVINSSEFDGLANFVTEKLERAGFSIISVTNGEESLEKCKILYGNGVTQTYSWQVLTNLFDCEEQKDSSLNEGEVEIYLDKNWAQMIKYSSYKK